MKNLELRVKRDGKRHSIRWLVACYGQLGCWKTTNTTCNKWDVEYCLVQSCSIWLFFHFHSSLYSLVMWHDMTWYKPQQFSGNLPVQATVRTELCPLTSLYYLYKRSHFGKEAAWSCFCPDHFLKFTNKFQDVPIVWFCAELGHRGQRVLVSTCFYDRSSKLALMAPPLMSMDSPWSTSFCRQTETKAVHDSKQRNSRTLAIVDLQKKGTHIQN